MGSVILSGAWYELTALTRRFVFGGKQVHDANIVATMPAHGEGGC